MSTRREFTRNQREQIVERSRNGAGEICCERCLLVLAGKPFEVDHIVPEALRPEADKKKPLTIADGQLLGKDCCHRGEDGKTNADVTRIAKAKRQNAKHIGIVRPASTLRGSPFPQSAKAARRKAKATEKHIPPPRTLFAPVGALFRASEANHDAD